jgi:hypothetical protein
LRNEASAAQTTADGVKTTAEVAKEAAEYNKIFAQSDLDTVTSLAAAAEEDDKLFWTQQVTAKQDALNAINKIIEDATATINAESAKLLALVTSIQKHTTDIANTTSLINDAQANLTTFNAAKDEKDAAETKKATAETAKQGIQTRLIAAVKEATDQEEVANVAKSHAVEALNAIEEAKKLSIAATAAVAAVIAGFNGSSGIDASAEHAIANAASQNSTEYYKENPHHMNSSLTAYKYGLSLQELKSNVTWDAENNYWKCSNKDSDDSTQTIHEYLFTFFGDTQYIGDIQITEPLLKYKDIKDLNITLCDVDMQCGGLVGDIIVNIYTKSENPSTTGQWYNQREDYVVSRNLDSGCNTLSVPLTLLESNDMKCVGHKLGSDESYVDSTHLPDKDAVIQGVTVTINTAAAGPVSFGLKSMDFVTNNDSYHVNFTK